MTQQWTVKAWAGPYSWTVTDADPAGYGLASPMTITQSMPDVDLAPLVQPNPGEATFSVIVANVADLDQLDLGDTVTLRYWPSRTPAAGDKPVVEFAGRVSNLLTQPHDLGALYQVSCMDYLGDLAEPIVGDVAYGAATGDDRIRAILSDAGYALPVAPSQLYYPGDPLPSGGWATLAARNAGPTSALELLTHTCQESYLHYLTDADWGVPSIQPLLSPAAGTATFSSGPTSLDSTRPFLVKLIRKAWSYSPPLRVVNVAGVYMLQGAAADSSALTPILDAGKVDMGVTFAQRKSNAVTDVVVTSSAFSARRASSGQLPRVVAQVDTELSFSAEGQALADQLLPPVQAVGGLLWVADTLHWELDQETGTAWFLPQLAQLLAVVRVKLAWNPTEREWLTGLVQRVVFRLEGGAPSVDVDTVPWATTGTAATIPLTFATITAAATFTNLSTRDTFDDYKLARS